jgi:thioredoxin reductase (NADPH)
MTPPPATSPDPDRNRRRHRRARPGRACFQVFELGLLEIKAHVIDSLAYPGGQCVELYPDKPIYDIPAVPVCTGQELTDSLLKQIEPFGATFHYGQEVTVVEKQDDGRFFVQTSKGTRF